MWGEYVKVVTRRPRTVSSRTRVLEFGKGLSGRPVLRLAGADERLKDPGTLVRVRLDRPPEQGGGILGPGPIESWFGFPEMVSREKPWSLRNLCAWLCPALDVNLIVEWDGEARRPYPRPIGKRWRHRSCFGDLLLHRDDIDSICADDFFRRIAANVRDIPDECGRAPGTGGDLAVFGAGRFEEGTAESGERRLRPDRFVLTSKWR